MCISYTLCLYVYSSISLLIRYFLLVNRFDRILYDAQDSSSLFNCLVLIEYIGFLLMLLGGNRGSMKVTKMGLAFLIIYKRN